MLNVFTHARFGVAHVTYRRTSRGCPVLIVILLNEMRANDIQINKSIFTFCYFFYSLNSSIYVDNILAQLTGCPSLNVCRPSTCGLGVYVGFIFKTYLLDFWMGSSQASHRVYSMMSTRPVLCLTIGAFLSNILYCFKIVVTYITT